MFNLRNIFNLKKVKAEEDSWAIELGNDAENDWSDWDKAVAREWLDWGMDNDTVTAIPIVDGVDPGDDWDLLI